MAVALDPRIEELEALAHQEGFHLPMAADLIAYFEQQGYVVDLCSGEVCQSVTVALSPNAQALCHLYGVDDANISALYEAEAIDLEEDMLDREYHARGEW